MKGLTGFLKQSTPTAADTHSPDTFRFFERVCWTGPGGPASSHGACAS
ncbi:hypothetical protein RCH06_000447 [Polaromonas sp. CG_9.5]|nr:hypothetical protein [Polaromonas sp. CG_9.5]